MKIILIHLIIVLLVPLKSLSQTIPIKIDLICNGNKLNAFFYPSEKDYSSPTLILLLGYPGNQNFPLGLGEKLSPLGINVLAFNYQGTWNSEGDFSFESSMQDAGSAIKFLKKKETIEKFKVDTSNIILGGYSYGGGMALNAAIYNPEIRKIISIAGADESVFGRKMLADQNYRNVREQMLFKSFYPNGPIKGDFEAVITFWLSNLDRYDLVLNADSLKDKDILLIGGWDDTGVVIEEHIIPLYRKLQYLDANQLEVMIFNTDHSFQNVREELTETIYRWITNER
ncbi:MAG: prolyl oligopeptidase family serine peptidase [Bacteroidales bacterium]|nr:prolyl oligopeptidase family serine peptidase [Bacteroidales bacterium]